jgi:hypothetical protein
MIVVNIFLILSIIHILPFKISISQNSSAGSIWLETDWSIPSNYSDISSVDTTSIPGEISLLYMKGVYVSDSWNHRIIQTNMNGNIWTAYGTMGSGTGQIWYPAGIDLDNKTGDIYISDRSNDRIVKTKINGSGWTTYGTLGSGTGNFKTPLGLSYDRNSGFIWITDNNNNRIVKTKINGNGWTSYGTIGSGTGQFQNHCGIFYDNKNDFAYIGDLHRIVKTMINGSGWNSYGSYGSGIGQFDGASGIHYDDTTGFVYIADTWNDRIVKTKMNGSGWKSLGSVGSGKFQFNGPAGLYYDNNTGFIYVADSQNGRIVKTKIDGSGWTTFGTSGSGRGQFNCPQDVVLYDDNYCSEGYLTSKYYNCNGSTKFKIINWTAMIPPWTSMKFQLRSAPNSSALDLKDFVGPDGSDRTYYSTSGATIWPGHNNDCWIQYRVYLSTNDVNITPILKDVTITYNVLPDRPILNSPLNNSITNNSTPTFSWTFIDKDSLQQHDFQLQIDDNENFNSVDYDWGQINSNVSSFQPITNISDGKWFWRVRTRDSDGDWGQFSSFWTIIIDTKQPKSEISYPLDKSYYKQIETIEGNATDPFNGTAITRVEIIIKRLFDNNYWNGSDWNPIISWLPINGIHSWKYNSNSVKWTSGFQYFIQSRATDEALNIEKPKSGILITIDVENPSSTIEVPLNNSYINKLEIIVGNATDINGSGIEEVEIRIKHLNDDIFWDGTNWNRAESWLPATGTNYWNYNVNKIPWSTDTYYVIHSRATDNIGNREVTYPMTLFMYDDKPPQISILINKGDKFTRFHDTKLSLYSFDSGSRTVRMSFSSDNNSWSAWEQINMIKSFNLSAPDGLKFVYFKAMDRAGNIAIPKFDSIILDTKPPENLAIYINNNSKYTNSNKVTLSLSAKDSLSGLKDMTFSFDGSTWTDWELFNYSKTIYLPFVDGNKVVYFRVCDKAGNIAQVNDTIILDTKPPHSLTIIINDGALETNSTNVSLKLSAIDALSGVTHLSLSENGEDWSNWENFSETKLLNLSSGDGIKTIFFKVKDLAGNIADPVSTSIILNTSKPNNNETQEKGELKETNYEIYYLLIIIVFIIIIILILLLMRYKKNLNGNITSETEVETQQELSQQIDNISQPDQQEILPKNQPPQHEQNICPRCSMEMVFDQSNNGYNCVWCKRDE